MTTLSWKSGEAAVQRVVERAWPSCDTTRILSESRQRRVLLVGGDRPLVVKHYRLATGGHPLRDRFKSGLGLDAAFREHRALGWLEAARIPAPRPLGLARTAEGDALVVMEPVGAHSLWSELESRPGEQRARLLALAEIVRRLHDAGLAHGDLHPGNVMIEGERLVLIDLHRARRTSRGDPDQLRDLGRLDHSLRQLAVPRTTRVRVLQTALGVQETPRIERHRATREASLVSGEISRQHARLRARQAGRRAARPTGITP